MRLALSTRWLKRAQGASRSFRCSGMHHLHQFNSLLFLFLIFQAAKAAEAALKKKERGGGIGVPDVDVDDDDILALSAVSLRVLSLRVLSLRVLFAKACVTRALGNRRGERPRLGRRCGARSTRRFESVGERPKGCAEGSAEG